ncbi:MAG: PEP-CTERM sorting domain-containing protein [Verrucomicrobia bacterium]|nr:PEP-CTERM sorting domain-containing protein [Verrucomicrobiota bacterium]
MKKILHTSLIAVLPMGYAWADTVSNFTNDKNGLCAPFAVSQSILYAGSFTTGSFADGYKLDDVFWSVVSVNVFDAVGIQAGATFQVQLWGADGLGNPKTPPLETLSGPSKPKVSGGTLAPGIMDYKSAGSFLKPNTTYWVSATVIGGNDLRVRLERTNLSDEKSNPAGWTIGNTSYILDTSDVSIPDPVITKDSSCLPYLTIVATPVPEPSTVALLGLTGAGLLLLARRRK